MPTILVEFLAPLSRITRKKEEAVQVENDDTVQTLLEKLSARHGDKFRAEVFDAENKMKGNVCLLVNGIRIAELNEAFGQRVEVFLLVKGG